MLLSTDLHDAPSTRQHESKRAVGGGPGENVRGVADRDSASIACFQVHVVDSNPAVAHNLMKAG